MKYDEGIETFVADERIYFRSSARRKPGGTCLVCAAIARCIAAVKRRFGPPWVRPDPETRMPEALAFADLREMIQAKAKNVRPGSLRASGHLSKGVRRIRPAEDCFKVPKGSGDLQLRAWVSRFC
jgi:hypothetical protein